MKLRMKLYAPWRALSSGSEPSGSAPSRSPSPCGAAYTPPASHPSAIVRRVGDQINDSSNSSSRRGWRLDGRATRANYKK